MEVSPYRSASSYIWCERWESNPHGIFHPSAFETDLYASSSTLALFLVRMEGVEPTRPYGHRVLSATCMPFQHTRLWWKVSESNRLLLLFRQTP